jgi:type II secretory pathway pseudopilin PulG
MVIAVIITVILHSAHRRTTRAAFTFVEALVAISLIGIGVATSLTALLKINSIAFMGRNATGAQTFAQNEIDKFLSYSPFNPQKTNLSDGTLQVPKDPNNSPPAYDLTLGTHTYSDVPIYNDPDNGVVVTGTITTVISDVSQTYNGVTIPMYRAVVTVSYNYLNRSYASTASTVRVSDI